MEVKKRRLDAIASSCLNEVYRKKARLQRMQMYARRVKYVRMAEKKRDPLFRVVVHGLTHLRAAWAHRMLRRGFERWFEEAWGMASCQAAAEHEEVQLARRTLRALRSYVRAAVERRRRREYEERMRREAKEVRGQAGRQARAGGGGKGAGLHIILLPLSPPYLRCCRCCGVRPWSGAWPRRRRP